MLKLSRGNSRLSSLGAEGSGEKLNISTDVYSDLAQSGGSDKMVKWRLSSITLHVDFEMRKLAMQAMKTGKEEVN